MAAKVQLIGGLFQDNEGNVLVSGYLMLKLSQDESVAGSGQICSGIETKITLNASGSVDQTSAQSVWGNDQMLPVNSYYRVTGYKANGQLAWGPNNQQVTGSGGTFDVGTWVPNTVLSWTPFPQTVTLQTNEVNNGSQTVLDLHAGTNMTLTDNGSGRVTLDAANSGLSLNTAGRGWFWSTSSLTSAVGSATSVIDDANNRVRVVQLILNFGITVRKISIRVVAGFAASTATCGIYDITGNTRLLDAGANAFSTATANSTQTVTLGTPVVLPAGIYWVAYGCTNGGTASAVAVNFQAQGTFTNAEGSFLNINTPRVGFATNTLSSGAMPATLGAITADITENPICILFEP